jgi:hypothetical protein
VGTPEHRLEALKEASMQAKSDMVLFGAPLLLFLAQLRFLVMVDQTLIKLLATLGMVSLFIGLLSAWCLWSVISAWYAKELLCKEGRVDDGLGARFLRAVDSDGDRLSEDVYLKIRAALYPVMMSCLLVGYLALAILLVFLIWS